MYLLFLVLFFLFYCIFIIRSNLCVYTYIYIYTYVYIHTLFLYIRPLAALDGAAARAGSTRRPKRCDAGGQLRRYWRGKCADLLHACFPELLQSELFSYTFSVLGKGLHLLRYCIWDTCTARHAGLFLTRSHQCIITMSLQHITLHYIALYYITLHYITLHYITLHYIGTPESEVVGPPRGGARGSARRAGILPA